MSNANRKFQDRKLIRELKYKGMKLDTVQKICKVGAKAFFTLAVAGAIFTPADGYQAYFVDEGLSNLPYEVQVADEGGVKHYDFLQNGEPKDHITAAEVVEQVGLDNGYRPVVLDNGTQVLAGAQEDYTGKTTTAGTAALVGVAALGGAAYAKKRKEEIEDELDEIENYSEVDQPRRREAARQEAMSDMYVRPIWRDNVRWPNVSTISPMRHFSGRPRIVMAGSFDGLVAAESSYVLREEQTRTR